MDESQRLGWLLVFSAQLINRILTRRSPRGRVMLSYCRRVTPYVHVRLGGKIVKASEGLMFRSAT